MQVFPLTKVKFFHMIISIGILLWVVVHMMAHFASFALEDRNASSNVTAEDHFRENIKRNIIPTVTGIVAVIIFAVMGLVQSIDVIRKQLRFIPFHLTHWIGGGLFYILLLLHGVNGYNPSFWKWFIPAIVILALERIYRFTAVNRRKVAVKCAGRYDDQSRTALVELEVPKGFKYEPGQYILLNLPWIGQYSNNVYGHHYSTWSLTNYASGCEVYQQHNTAICANEFETPSSCRPVSGYYVDKAT